MCWRSVKWWHWCLLLAILLLAGTVRCINLSKNSLWTDEFLSLECSSGWARSDAALAGRAVAAPDLVTLCHAKPWTTIWSSVGSDENHPPLYFLLLRGWRVLFGDSPAAIRSLSVCASILAILFLFGLGVEICGPAAALWACVLMAVASPQIEQAQDARAYIPVTAACLGAALALLRIHRLGPGVLRCGGLFVAALVAPMMHYMAFATLPVLLIFALLGMRGSSRRCAVYLLIGCAITFAFVWGPQLIVQHYRMNDDTDWLLDDQANHVTSVIKDLCSLPARLFLDLDLDTNNAPAAGLGVGAFLLPLLFFRRRNQEILFPWAWLVLPVLIGLVIDLTSHRRSLSMVRYTLAAAPGLYLLAGTFADRVKHVGWIPPAIVAACCALCVPCDYITKIPDYREIPRFIARSSRPDDPVVFVEAHRKTYSNEALLCVDYYLASQKHPIYILDRQPSAALVAKLKDARHICVISDNISLLDAPMVPGLAIDRAELLAGIAVVGVADATPQLGHLARQKYEADPVLKLALGLR